MNESLRRLAVIPVLLAVLTSGAPVLRADEEATEGSAPRTATIQGRVFGSDRTTPIAGAVVRAVRGDGVQVYSSLPTDDKGSYSLVHLAPGAYDILVELPDGIYLVERTFNVSRATLYSLSLAAVPAENVQKRVTAVDKPVKGYAWTLEGQGKRAGGFWRTPGGIAIIAGGAAGVIALAASGGDDNNKGSNSTP